MATRELKYTVTELLGPCLETYLGTFLFCGFQIWLLKASSPGAPSPTGQISTRIIRITD
jgi:hypothetical protein